MSDQRKPVMTNSEYRTIPAPASLPDQHGSGSTDEEDLELRAKVEDDSGVVSEQSDHVSTPVFLALLALSATYVGKIILSPDFDQCVPT